MPRLSIPKVRDDRPPVEYRLRLDAALHEELELYRTLYAQTYGQAIEAKDLLEPIVRKFLSGDRAFRRYKRNAGATPPRAPIP